MSGSPWHGFGRVRRYPPAPTVTAAATKSASESRSESRTLGAYIEQRISYRDRLFVTGKWWPWLFEIEMIPQ